MTIDWNQFTPWLSLSGGLMLGFAAALFILVNGRILGISGILGGLLTPKRGDLAWRVTFLLGLLAAPTVFHAVAPSGLVNAPRINATVVQIVGAGLLVGIGTRYSAGCTSGHGVCGLSRLSPRSLVATLSFMGTGFVTVFAIRHFL